ncbi:MAG: DICT sensory domain-containing protein [Pyrinomonadaceae bacterium]
MFEHAMKLAKPCGAAQLGEVSNVSQRDFDARETFCFRSVVPCLEYVSLLIKSALLLRTNRKGRVYVGFEKFSRMEAIIDRYLRIADVSERVYVFGEDIWQPPRHPNMKLIPVASDSPMAREWFVIADSSTLRVALVASDEDGFDAPVLEARRFRAIKTSDEQIVAQLAAAAEGLIDSSLAA